MDAADEPGQGAAGRNETEKERLDRNLQDLLAGLRVALPGVQVLFAFLLILPFQVGFADKVTDFQEGIYFVTLISTALASILLIAPSARHRVRFRQDDKRWVVLTGNRLGMAGLGFLGLAITGAILLISDVLFGRAEAIIASGAVALLLIWLWFVAPLQRTWRDEGGPGGRGT